MKSENGITLVALILTVIVLIIIAGVSVQSGTESLDKTRLNGFYTQLKIIQKRVDDIAATNESYVDSNGNTIYLKEQGSSLTGAQLTKLQSILDKEEITNPLAPDFRYFTAAELEDTLDLLEMEYNVFINFENRIIVAEDGIAIGDTTYYILKDETYFVEQNNINKNIGSIESLNYSIVKYNEDKYKVTVAANNTIGDLRESGYVKYKKTTTKYWETSTNTEMVAELDVEYNIIYVDSNNNKLEKTIKVELGENNTNPFVTEVQ